MIRPTVFDSEAERLVIGQVLNGSAAMDAMRGTMEADDFAEERHRIIWQTACEIYDDGKGQVDHLSVIQSLCDKGKLRPDDRTYIPFLLDGLPEMPCLDRHIDRLKDKALVRRIAAIAGNLEKRALSGMESGEDLRDALGKSIADLAETAAIDRRPVSATELIEQIGIEELLRPRRVESIRLPWDRLDNALKGLRPGQNVIVAADTGRGKTSAACQIATHALRQGKSVLYWSMEMPARALFGRMVGQLVGGRADGHPTFQERERERSAVGILCETPVFFDCHSRTVPSFCASIRQVRQKTRLGLIVVDYLGLIRSAGKAESRTREVGENSRALKLAAMDFNLPFLVLSQFSRQKEGAKPSIHSLKESGDVENDADVILLLIAGELSKDAPTPVEVFIGKQREGSAGWGIPLIFYPQSQSFCSAEDWNENV